jgi:hypothetical protein
MKKPNDKFGITFEVRNNIRQIDGVRMPQPMLDGWYWSYDNPAGWSYCAGPFPDGMTAVKDMAARHDSIPNVPKHQIPK